MTHEELGKQIEEKMALIRKTSAEGYTVYNQKMLEVDEIYKEVNQLKSKLRDLGPRTLKGEKLPHPVPMVSG
jgi:hypothetical protein